MRNLSKLSWEQKQQMKLDKIVKKHRLPDDPVLEERRRKAVDRAYRKKAGKFAS